MGVLVLMRSRLALLGVLALVVPAAPLGLVLRSDP
jgi:hypothetical protein